MRGENCNVWKTGRKYRKGSICYEAEECEKDVFGEYLASVTGMEVLMQSLLEVNVRSGGVVPRREWVDCNGEVAEIRFLVGGASGWSIPKAVATVSGGCRSGCH